MTTTRPIALRFTFVHFLLLFGALLLTACSKQESGKVDNIQLARFYADNGTYSLALSTLGQEQQKTPNDPRIYQELARIYLELGYATDALNEIDKAIARGCSSSECRELRLRSLIATGKTGAAEQQLKELGDALPPERRQFYQARIDLRKGGDRKQAIERFRNIPLPEARTAHLQLLFAERRYPEIIEIYEQRKGKPVPVDDWLVYAKTLYLLKRHEDADRALIELRLADKSDVISPRKIQAVELQVKNNIAQNKFAEAQAIYDAFLENYKGSGYVALQEAVKDLKSRNFDAAIQNIESLVEASPDNLQSSLILALAQFGKGDYRAVVDTLSLFRDKLDDAGKSLLAKAYLNQGQADPVIQLIGNQPASLALRMDLASAWLLKGKRDQAAALLAGIDDKAMKPNELLQYAQLLNRLGEHERLSAVLSARELKDPRLQRLHVDSLLKQQQMSRAEDYARSINDPRQSLELQIYLALQQKDRQKALELQQKLTADRQSKQDDAKLAALYLANGQNEEGFAALKRGFAKPGDNTPFLKMLRVLLKQGEQPEIRQWMEDQPATVDGYAELQLLLAESELKANPEQARQRLQPLMDKNDPRAVVLMARSDPQNAGPILQQALERKYNPLIAQLLYQYYLKKGDKQGLKLLLERIDQKQVESPQKQALLARGYLRLGDLTRAASYVDALEKQGVLAQAQELRGDIHLAAGRKQQAVKAYATALKAQPQDALAAKYIQARLAAGEKSDAVLADAERLLKQHPRFTALKGLLAASYLQNRPEQARKLYEEIIKAQPGNVTALNNLAWLYLERDAGRALQLSKAALRLAPRNLNVADTFIRALDRSGQGDKARELLDQLRRKNPDSKILQQLEKQLS